MPRRLRTRHTNRGRPAPAIRIFTGETVGRRVGDAFDSYRKSNGMPCGTWTIIATVEADRITGGHLARNNWQACAVTMLTTMVLAGAGFGQSPWLVSAARLFQRTSIITGFA